VTLSLILVVMVTTQSNELHDAVTKADALEVLAQAGESVSMRTLDRYIADGKIRRYKFHNGRVKLNLDDVLALTTPMAPAVDASYPQASQAGASSVSEDAA